MLILLPNKLHSCTFALDVSPRDLFGPGAGLFERDNNCKFCYVRCGRIFKKDI